MAFRNFTPKVKQLEEINVALDENDEKQIKINSKKKWIDNNQQK